MSEHERWRPEAGFAGREARGAKSWRSREEGERGGTMVSTTLLHELIGERE
jgi:hypothetical protein